ncbi:MAG: NYN domain-containing protein [Alphaproteobacteria bacterium BRH_c36]|nr:MAG: NYN domain-containing protein [Alphaproteobacteria bacterium BRH_c36]
MTTMNLDFHMALFCDFENVALGVRDAKIPKFDMTLVLERLLLKGSIVVKKAYCDWDRYKEFKQAMHDAAFELIEIPHTRQSGKNSADIRMVVDALDLCYTKEHINTFVIISGDSDFSPLVSKLRENAKTVIGVGVKNSTSDLLMNNCDEYIFYDDLARADASTKSRARRPTKKKTAAEAKPAKAVVATDKAEATKEAGTEADRRDQAIEFVLETTEGLFAEGVDRVWGSMVKQTLKRRRPGFNEAFYGFRSFSDLLEEAEDRGFLELEPDERSGGYIIRAVRRDE